MYIIEINNQDRPNIMYKQVIKSKKLVAICTAEVKADIYLKGECLGEVVYYLANFTKNDDPMKRAYDYDCREITEMMYAVEDAWDTIGNIKKICYITEYDLPSEHLVDVCRYIFNKHDSINYVFPIYKFDRFLFTNSGFTPCHYTTALADDINNDYTNKVVNKRTDSKAIIKKQLSFAA